MRFHTSSSPTTLERRRQRRWLALTLTLVAVLFAVQIYRNNQQSVGQRADQGDDAVVSPVNYEFSVATEPTRALSPDERTSSTASPRRLKTVTKARLDKTVLETVRDDTLGIRREEAEAFFVVLDHVCRVPAADLEHAARDDVLHVNLMVDPDTFRGELLTIAGELRRCTEFAVTPNEFGIDQLYEAWVFTGDSGEHPYRIVASSVGDGIPVSSSQPTPVRITGYYFKREGYDTPSGLRVAPTILAQSIAIDHTVPAPVPVAGLSPGLLGVAVAVGLILTATLFSFAWSDRSPRRLRASLPSMSADALAAIEQVDRRSVNEQLRELSERERFGGATSPPR